MIKTKWIALFGLASAARDYPPTSTNGWNSISGAAHALSAHCMLKGIFFFGLNDGGQAFGISIG